MNIEVKTFPKDIIEKKVNLTDDATVLDLLKNLDLRPDSWIAVRNDKAIPDDAVLKDGDSIKLLSVISGG